MMASLIEIQLELVFSLWIIYLFYYISNPRVYVSTCGLSSSSEIPANKYIHVLLLHCPLHCSGHS